MQKKSSGLLAIALLAFLFFAAPAAKAYYSVIDTGELTAVEKYRAILEPQLILMNYPGGQIVGRFDTGVDQNSAVRAIVGFGTVSYEVGALYKFIPFPDTGNQPAVGGEAGVEVSSINSQNYLSFRFHPLISKKIKTPYGYVSPYGSIPMGITAGPQDTYIPIQLAGGVEWKPAHYDGLRLFGEAAVNLNRAFGYLSVAAGYDF